MCCRSLGASVRDSDSEEEWSGGGGYASDGGASAGAWDDGEVEVSPEDERAMAAFMVGALQGLIYKDKGFSINPFSWRGAARPQIPQQQSCGFLCRCLRRQRHQTAAGSVHFWALGDLEAAQLRVSRLLRAHVNVMDNIRAPFVILLLPF